YWVGLLTGKQDYSFQVAHNHDQETLLVLTSTIMKYKERLLNSVPRKNMTYHTLMVFNLKSFLTQPPLLAKIMPVDKPFETLEKVLTYGVGLCHESALNMLGLLQLLKKREHDNDLIKGILMYESEFPFAFSSDYLMGIVVSACALVAAGKVKTPPADSSTTISIKKWIPKRTATSHDTEELLQLFKTINHTILSGSFKENMPGSVNHTVKKLFKDAKGENEKLFLLRVLRETRHPRAYGSHLVTGGGISGPHMLAFLSAIRQITSSPEPARTRDAILKPVNHNQGYSDSEVVFEVTRRLVRTKNSKRKQNIHIDKLIRENMHYYHQKPRQLQRFIGIVKGMKYDDILKSYGREAAQVFDVLEEDGAFNN
ncbi:MAG: hypothetical protein K0U52_06795, partial [Gammaproteobacteria bacterium]|nr:hypothetical protein [Gammaproteobacteria bacterium]